MSEKKGLTRRTFLKAGGLAAAGGLLAACAPPPAAPKAANAPAANAPAANVPAAGTIVELKWMSPDRELSNKTKANTIAKFNAQMEKDGKPWRLKDVKGPATDNDLTTKYQLDAAAGSLSDIVDGLPSTQVADFAAAGYLLDLTPYIEKWDGWNQYFDVLKPFAYQSGKLVGLPSGTTFSWYYRKDVLAKAGVSLDQPKTWDDFYKVFDAIKTKTDAIPCGLPAATPWGGGTWDEGFRMVWLGFEGTMFDEKDNKWVVSSPNLLKALQVYETLAKNKWLHVEGLLTPKPWEPIKYQDFPKGKCAFVTGGDWQWEFDWGPKGATPIDKLFEVVDRWQFPSEKGQPFVYVDGSAGPLAAANTKSPEGVAEAIKFMADPVLGCENAKLYLGGPSARKDFGDKCPDYKTMVGGKYMQSAAFFGTGRTYRFSRVGTAKMSDGIARATEDIITLKKTAQEAMDAFAAAMLDAIPDNAKKA